MKVLLIGGHLTPALAMIDYIQAHHPQDELVFVGRELAQVTTRQVAHERQEVEKRKVPFFAFETGKIHQPHLSSLISEWWKWIRSLPKAWKILSAQKPDVIVSFGGYLAIPICLLGWIKEVPVITHEQTAVAGVANKLIAQFAQKVAVADEQAANFFPASKVVVTGNPLRPAISKSSVHKPDWTSTSTLPILYVTGGSQGAQQLNEIVQQAIPELAKHWQVVHQCGAARGQLDWQAKLTAVRKTLPTQLQKNFVIREWIDEQELQWLYRHVTLVVGRSGANTVWELQAAGRPALFIPLPKSHFDEQTKNAQRMVKAGAAQLLPITTPDASAFLMAVTEMKANLEKYQQAAKIFQKQMITNADQRLYELLAAVARP